MLPWEEVEEENRRERSKLVHAKNSQRTAIPGCSSLVGSCFSLSMRMLEGAACAISRVEVQQRRPYDKLLAENMEVTETN